MTSVNVRSPLVIKMLLNKQLSIMGFQEATWEWMEILQKKLFDYAWVGVGRDDGEYKGEFSPIFYLKEKYLLIDSGYFWLSDTPEKPSLGWDARCFRIATWVILEEKNTRKRFFYLNTHLDHVGENARNNGMCLILKRVKILAKSYPIILTGDLNSVEGSFVYQSLIENGLKDSKFCAIESMSWGTFHNYQQDDHFLQKMSPIDFIFMSPSFKVLKYEVMNQKMENLHLSDHYAVIVDFEEEAA